VVRIFLARFWFEYPLTCYRLGVRHPAREHDIIGIMYNKQVYELEVIREMLGQFKAHRSKAVIGFFLLLSLWLAYLATGIYSYSHQTFYEPSDVAIVLGAAVWNERPSPGFEERIRHAIRLYQQGQVEAIVMTGGRGRGDRLAESEVARLYAIQQGVPPDYIYYETRSRTTRENLREARTILDQQGLATALIVSDPLHMKRAVTIARDLGIDAHPSPTPTSRYRTWRTKLRFLLRETYFCATYFLRKPLHAIPPTP
jgi:uncharacterized SAM-binding protein YcdF (DUF218 family)